MVGRGARVPADVRRFLNRTIDSVEQLEVLLLLQRGSERYWDAVLIAENLGLRQGDAASALESLARQNLLDVKLGQTIKYQYAPASAAQRDAIRQLGELFRDHRQQLLNEVAARREALRHFSDAFRIRRSEDDRG